ncbi:MAG TPA: PKD domain-containing protein [Phycisphaerales bacterium]
MQNRGKSLNLSAAALALAAGAACASAQLGAFPYTPAPKPQSPLPYQLEMAVQSKAQGARAAMLRASLIQHFKTSVACYRPDMTQAQWEEAINTFQLLPPTQAPSADPFEDRFNVDNRKWSSAGNATAAPGDAARANLTYSFPADGTTWGLAGSGFPTGSNNLIASLTTAFGNEDTGKEYIRQAFAAWKKYAGITYTENSDSGIAMDQVATRRASVGDIRVGGLALGSSTPVLAYNAFPGSPSLASIVGGDMVINTSYFSVAGTFPDASNNYRYFRNTVTHEHGHGTGFIHQVPCTGFKLMEPSISTGIDSHGNDDRRGATRNYGDRYSGNQSLATALDLGNLTTPALRSFTNRDLSLNGFWNNGSNAGGADFYKFTLDSAQNVRIVVTPRGGSITTGQQSSGCSGTTTTYAASSAANLAYVLTNGDGTVVIGSIDATANGSAENNLFSNLPAGNYVLRVYDNDATNLVNSADPNDVVQLYDLDVQVGTNIYANPYANAGVNKRVRANTTARFIGNIHSATTEIRVATSISRYEWDLDGDGVFETGVAPAASQPQPTFTYVSNGVYNVSLRVRDSNAKTTVDTIQVTVTNGVMTVTGTPVVGQAGTVVPFTLTGTNLKNVTVATQVSVTTGSGVTVTGTPVPNALGTQVTGLSFNIAPNATLGGQTVRVLNADGNVSTTNFLTVTAPPCPADFNSDGFVDDADFVIFAAAYGILDCADPNMPVGCPSDLNNDGFVDDTDFVIFAGAYEALLCP